jgi:hypothetical protein
MINRRGLITGLISLVAAPAIVRAGSLMPVKVMIEPRFLSGTEINALYQAEKYEFLDYQAFMIRYTGRILIDLIPRIYEK